MYQGRYRAARAAKNTYFFPFWESQHSGREGGFKPVGTKSQFLLKTCVGASLLNHICRWMQTKTSSWLFSQNSFRQRLPSNPSREGWILSCLSSQSHVGGLIWREMEATQLKMRMKAMQHLGSNKIRSQRKKEISPQPASAPSAPASLHLLKLSTPVRV